MENMTATTLAELHTWRMDTYKYDVTFRFEPDASATPHFMLECSVWVLKMVAFDSLQVVVARGVCVGVLT